MSLETPTIEEIAEIKHKEVAELYEPMLRIFEQIVEKLEGGKYDLIIGIDASGRIPTLIVDKLTNYIYTKKGNEYYKTRFLAGSGSKESAARQIHQWNPHKKVLIVEDTLITGNSVRFLTEALKEKGIHFDIATVSGVFNSEKSITSSLGADDVYCGMRDNTSIYAQRHLSGVVKDRGGDTFSKPYKKIVSEQSKTKVQESINQSRNDADVVINRLIDWYESRTKSSSPS